MEDCLQVYNEPEQGEAEIEYAIQTAGHFNESINMAVDAFCPNLTCIQVAGGAVKGSAVGNGTFSNATRAVNDFLGDVESKEFAELALNDAEEAFGMNFTAVNAILDADSASQIVNAVDQNMKSNEVHEEDWFGQLAEAFWGGFTSGSA